MILSLAVLPYSSKPSPVEFYHDCYKQGCPSKEAIQSVENMVKSMYGLEIGMLSILYLLVYLQS